MRKGLLLVLGLLLILVAPTSAQINQFVGNWINTDPDTGGVPRLEIRQTGNDIRVHAWGKCTPEYCDWGEVVAYTYGANVSSSLPDDTQAIWADFSNDFSEKFMLIRLLDDGPLQAEILTRFTDQSERSSYVSLYTFRRDSGLSAPQQISPVDGVVFGHFPRTTTLAWSTVNEASSYSVEVDCFHCCQSDKWCTDVGQDWLIETGLTTTSFTFDYVGAQPGRWRVWAVDGSGQEGQKSGWQEFTYSR